jgi:hypothetical protein
MSQYEWSDVRQVLAEDVYVPVGFDDNDKITVVFEGILPNSCYKTTDPEVNVDYVNGAIHIIPQAIYSDEVPCIQKITRYDTVVNLEPLPYGDYEILVNEDRTIKETLVVEEASSSGPDDFQYAPVDRVVINNENFTGQYMAYLHGVFNDSCMIMKEVKVVDSGKTLQVQPVVEVLDNQPCQDGLFPYEKAVSLPWGIEKGRHLLHVRVENGNSLNQMFSVLE